MIIRKEENAKTEVQAFRSPAKSQKDNSQNQFNKCKEENEEAHESVQRLQRRKCQGSLSVLPSTHREEVRWFEQDVGDGAVVRRQWRSSKTKETMAVWYHTRARQ